MLSCAVPCRAVPCLCCDTMYNGVASGHAGGLAGSIAWWSVYPLDVIKSRIQASSKAESEYKGTESTLPWCLL